jgi:hypothetical protein
MEVFISLILIIIECYTIKLNNPNFIVLPLIKKINKSNKLVST